MTKLQKESPLRVSIRPKLRVNSIAKITKEDPNSFYKLVRFDEAFDPMGERLDQYMDRGWEIVHSADSVFDDRTNVPKSEEESLREHPVTKTGRGGAQFVLMKITKDRFTKNKIEDTKTDAERYRISSQSKIERKGKELKITDPEVNEHNIKK